MHIAPRVLLLVELDNRCISLEQLARHDPIICATKELATDETAAVMALILRLVLMELR